MSLAQSVANTFRANPGRWIDGRKLSKIGGYSGFRTRISECRRDFGMPIRNQVRTLRSGARIGFYIYEPKEQ